MRTYTRMAAAIAALLVIGCGDEPSAPVERDQAVTDAELLTLQLSADFLEARDVLGMVGGMPMGGMGMMGTGAGMGLATSMPGTRDPSGTVVFVGMPRGFDVTRTVKFYDGKGVLQARFDTLTTARVETDETMKGSHSFTLNGETRSSTMESARKSSVSGLEGKETQVTLNASGSHKVVTTQASATKPTVTTTVTGSDVTKDLVIPVPRQRNSYPLSGTVTHEHTVTSAVTGGATRTRSYKEVMTFNGTATVRVQVTVDGQVKNCTRSLDGGRLACS